MNTMYKLVRERSGIIAAYATTLGLFVLVSFPGVVRLPTPEPVLAQQQAQHEYLLSESQEVSERPAEILSGKPARLVIPSMNIDMNILDGSYNPSTGEWDLGKDTIHFALPSVLANDFEGTTLVYGHNYDEIFGQLEGLPPEAKVQLYTENNLKFEYTYTSAKDLLPNDTTIFDYRGAPTLTLQTCTGNWNELRRMYSFRLDGVTQLQ